MRHRWKSSRHREPEELNITTFMNLMVILVPFLLITAVFSRMAILEVDLPVAQSEPTDEPPEFSLEVIIRVEAIEVAERTNGSLMLLPLVEGEYDYLALTDYLKGVKATYPEKVDATLLLEPDVEYDTLIQVMDAVRTYPETEEGEMIRAELFPELAIGDAPVLGGS